MNFLSVKKKRKNIMPKQQETETNVELPKGLMLRLPHDLHVAVRELAEDERRSLNSQLIILVELGLQQLGKMPIAESDATP